MNINNKPSIVVYKVTSKINTPEFNEFIWGIEEEEIPVTIIEVLNGYTNTLSYKAACCSSFDIGAAFGEDGKVAIHWAKLPIGEPLVSEQSTKKNRMRVLGSNAARLVKGIPLK